MLCLDSLDCSIRLGLLLGGGPRNNRTRGIRSEPWGSHSHLWGGAEDLVSLLLTMWLQSLGHSLCSLVGIYLRIVFEGQVKLDSL